MGCSGKNLLINGDFKELAPWVGKDVLLIKGSKLNHVLLKKGSTLEQLIKGPFETECAYYLLYDLLNITPDDKDDLFFATVSFLNSRQRIIKTTPVKIIPSERPNFQWHSYFSIIPNPTRSAFYAYVSFIAKEGSVHIRNVRLLSRSVS